MRSDKAQSKAVQEQKRGSINTNPFKPPRPASKAEPKPESKVEPKAVQSKKKEETKEEIK